MARRFLFRRGMIWTQAYFRQPIFRLWRSDEIFELVHAALGAYGLRLDDAKVDSAEGTLGKVCLTCSLFDYTTAIRIYLERVEVECLFLERTNEADLFGATSTILSALQTVNDTPAFRSYVTDLGLHGELEGQRAGEFVKTFFANVPGGMGSLAGSAASFYFTPESDDRIHSEALVLDLSGVIDGALLFRNRVTWEAGNLSPTDLLRLAFERRDHALSSVGLDLVKE